MIIPVILCGGSGTRLWPLSRTSYPKQLLTLVDGKSLLQQTLLRTRDIPNAGTPIVICNEEYRFITAEQLRDIGFEHAKIVLEPVGKNTAPAATIAALYLQHTEENPFLLLLPADHHIQDQAKFVSSVMNAMKIASQDKLVTFGVSPTKPVTGYGYIHRGREFSEMAFDVNEFVEKPDLPLAKKYLASGEYYWNSGMFLFKPDEYLKEVKHLAADIYEACQKGYKEMVIDTDFHRIRKEEFDACRSESIDYAVMEKSKKIAVVPLLSDWSDVGSWDAMMDIHEIDPKGNVIKGDVTIDGVTNSYLHAESRLVAAVGVSNLAVIETADAVLVTNRENSQNVKVLVNLLKKKKRTEVDRHRLEFRPWGHYETLNKHDNFHVKQIVVKPGGRLSLQMHRFRSEHWVITKGVALVTCGDKVFELHENQSTFIPAGMKHRLENLTDKPLNLIEVQTGTYFGEDDIIRFDDVYKRITEVN